MSDRAKFNMKSIGRNLRRLREESGLSVRDVKEYLDLGSVQAIYKYENGISYPPLDKFLAMMELYDAQWQDVAYGPRGDMSWNQWMYRRGQKPLVVFEIQRTGRMEHLKVMAGQITEWMCRHVSQTGNNS